MATAQVYVGPTQRQDLPGNPHIPVTVIERLGELRHQTLVARLRSIIPNHRAWLWTHLDHEGVESTDNASERPLRHAVTWRKLYFGAQSTAGCRFVERLLTVIETAANNSARR